ncbi:MAG: hypothetical protein HPY55_06610 [Firmicutes bacterium]|nr:hypothetical protein [Bacillota bacterium]
MARDILAAAPSSLYPLIIVVLMALLIAAASVIGYLLRDFKLSFERGQQKQDDTIDGLAKDLSNLKATLPEKFVMRDDFLRAVAGLDRKMDLVMREVTNTSRLVAELRGKEGARCD